MMQNYQFLPNYTTDHTLIYPNPYYYAPIMFIDPSMHLFSSAFNPYLANNTTLLQPSNQTKPHQNPTQGEIKNISENSSVENAQKYNSQSKTQQQIQYLKVSNRNILPNNLNLILSYIRRINKSGKVVKRVLEKLNKGKAYSLKNFYSYQAYLKEQIPFHKTKYTLKQITQHTDSNFNIFTLQQQAFYNKVCKILIFDFLRREYTTTLLTSGKIQKTSKKDHLKVRRYLQLKIEGASHQVLQPYRLIQN